MNGDYYADMQDAFPLSATEWLDTDLDGIGNNADTDDDNDGVLDASDAALLNPLNDLWSDVKLINAAPLGLQGTVSAMQLTLEAMNASLHYELKAIGKEISGFREEMRAELEALIAGLEGLEGNFTREIGELEALINTVSSITLAAIRQELASLEAMLELVESSLSSRARWRTSGAEFRAAWRTSPR